MNTLALLLSSRVKAELFRLLFGSEANELHVRELERRSGLVVSTVRQELKNLVRLGLVHVRRNGNRTYYRGNTEHPLFPEIHNLVMKTCGLADVLRDALGDGGIREAFVFGSLASGTEISGSDIDLMVIGTASLREVVKRLSRVSPRLGRELNPNVLTPTEFARRKKARDHFLSTVLKGPKLFVIGNEHDLERLGEERKDDATYLDACRIKRNALE